MVYDDCGAKREGNKEKQIASSSLRRILSINIAAVGCFFLPVGYDEREMIIQNIFWFCMMN